MNQTNGGNANGDAVDQTAGLGRLLMRHTSRLLCLVIFVLLAGSCILLVDETEFVIVERLGEIVAVYDRGDDRGLHFKCPWPIDTLRLFDRRVQLYDPPGREIFTRDKKNITIDTYVCWKIAEPIHDAAGKDTDAPVVRFFKSLGGIDLAEAQLDTRVRSSLSTRFGQVELGHLLSVEDSEQGPDGKEPGQLARLSDDVLGDVVQRPTEAQSIQERFGIEIIDVRIKRINFPAGNQQAVFERMKSERKKIAVRYRSAGMAENRIICSQADRQYGEILAKAQRKAEEIRGEAEAESISVLNEAHLQDPQFYRLVRTLDTYRKILNKKTTLVLSASNNLLKLFSDGVPDDETTTPRRESLPTGREEGKPGEKVSAAERSRTLNAGPLNSTVGGTP